MVRAMLGLPSWWTHRLFPLECRLPDPPTLRQGWHIAILLTVGGFLFFTRLSCPLLEPEETRYAEIPRQMLVRGQFVEPVWQGKPYYHKPPLLYWLVMLAYSVLGVHDWAARVVPAAASVGTALVTYYWGRRAFGPRAGFAGALILCLSGRFVYLGRMLTMDPLLCLWVTGALAAAHRAVAESRLAWRWWAGSALAAGLGLLTKGPVALALVLVPTVLFQWLDRRAARPSVPALAAYVGIALVVAGPWYAALAVSDPAAACEFLWLHNVQRYLDPVDHEEPLWFFLPGLVLGTLPWSLLLLPLAGGFRGGKKGQPPAVGYLLLALVWSVGFFSLSGCKRVGYILPALPALALCCGCSLVQLILALSGARSRLARWWPDIAAVMFVGLLLGVYGWLPGYHRRFALRGQVRPYAEAASHVQVLCYPKRWDSLTFYLQREDVRMFEAGRGKELVRAALARPGTLLFIKTSYLEAIRRELPPGIRFVCCGRQGGTLTVGTLRASRDFPCYTCLGGFPP
jgi:dolichol-phosphate mannosyltransferase